MSDQTPPAPETEPAAELPPVEAVAEVPAAVEPAAVEPAAVEPAAVEPAAVEPAAEAAAPAAPAQWPAAGYPAPPAYPTQEAPAPPAYPAAPAYPPAYPPAVGYPAPPAGPQTSSNAIIALILAITSWAICPVVTAIVALVLASNAAKEIEASGGRIQGQGLVTAARVVSWVNIGLWAAILVVGTFVLVLVAVAGSTSEINF